MTGHIRRRGERSWELKFDLGTDPLTGKRLTRYHSYKGTKRTAQIELTRLMASASEGNYVELSKTSLSEYLDRWERDWAAVNVSPKTLERYRELLRKHVRPHIGAVRLQNLRPVNLSELYAKLLREGVAEGFGLSARTVGHVHRALHKALVVAAEWGLIQHNPASVAKPPPVTFTEVEILTEADATMVLRQLRGRSLYPIVALALATGMRRGELLALTWKNVDLESARLRVEHSVEQTKAGLRIKAPKTRHGRRTISLPAWVVTDLHDHWRAQQEMRLRLGLGKAPEDALVFPNREGQPRSPNAVTKEWATAASRLGLPKVSLHALRHTHASQLIASGMDVLTISRRLGHGSPTITLGVYGHFFTNTDDRAAQVMEAAFGRVTTE
jgi:integrase